MKSIFGRLVIALLLGILVSVPTLAKVRKATITLKADTKVGEVVVKKGTYEVRFDDQSSELSILQKGKVIAKSAVQLEPLSTKYPDSAHIVSILDNQPVLTGVIFAGTRQTVVLRPTAAQATIKN